MLIVVIYQKNIYMVYKTYISAIWSNLCRSQSTIWPYSFEHNVIFIMSYYECEAGEHLAPLPRIGDENDSDIDSNSSDDSGVEVVSTYDADEY